MFLSKIDHKLKPAMISRSANGWKLIRIANGCLSCENSDLDTDDIRRVEEKLKPRYKKAMQEYNVFVSYDNWSGVFIMQMPGFEYPKADRLIEDIYAFLSDIDM